MVRPFPFMSFNQTGYRPGWLNFLARNEDPETGTSPARKPAATTLAPLAMHRLELLSWTEAETHVDAWRDLVTRTSDQNVFLEPAFALTAIRHSAAARRPNFLLVWDKSSAPEKLVGLCPLMSPVETGQAIATVWHHEEAPFGGLLLDAQQGPDVFASMLGWLAARNAGLCGMLFPMLPIEKALGHMLGDPRAATLETRIVEGSEHALVTGTARLIAPRVAGRPDNDDATAGMTRDTAATQIEVRAAFEDFLALDAQQSRGPGLALIDRPGLTTFARAATRLLGREGKCRVERLIDDGRTLAAAIVLQSGAQSVIWKIAHVRAPENDAAVRRFMRDVLGDETGRATIFCTDMTETVDAGTTRLDRLVLADVLVAVPGCPATDMRAAMRRERRRRFARSIGRHLVDITGGPRRS